MIRPGIIAVDVVLQNGFLFLDKDDFSNGEALEKCGGDFRRLL
jgi:hypothetical protein